MSIQAVPLSQFIPNNTTQIQTVAKSTASFIRSLAKKGGPDQTDYPLLNNLFQQFSQTTLHGKLFLPNNSRPFTTHSVRPFHQKLFKDGPIKNPWATQEISKLLKKSIISIGHQSLIS